MKWFLKYFKKAFLQLQRWEKFRHFVYFDIKNEPFLWLLHKGRSLIFGFWETLKTTKIMLFLIIHSDETIFEALQKSIFTTTKSSVYKFLIFLNSNFVTHQFFGTNNFLGRFLEIHFWRLS